MRIRVRTDVRLVTSLARTFKGRRQRTRRRENRDALRVSMLGANPTFLVANSFHGRTPKPE